MEQVLIREGVSPLKESRKVSGEIMASLLHLLGSYRQGALGKSQGVEIVCAFRRKMKPWTRVCAFRGFVDGGCKNLSHFGKTKPGVWGALVFGWGEFAVCQPLILVGCVSGA